MVQATSKKCIYSALPMQVFMIHAIKVPLADGFFILCQRRLRQKREGLKKIAMAFRNMGKLPEPTIENTWHPNTHNMIHLRTWLFANYPILGQFNITRRAINFAIIIHAFDPPWRWIMESVGEEAGKLEWTGWQHDIRNMVALKRYFGYWCHLSKERMNLIKRSFDACVVLYILCPPFRKLIKAIRIKAQEMKWEGKTYGHEGMPANWNAWWRDPNPNELPGWKPAYSSPEVNLNVR